MSNTVLSLGVVGAYLLLLAAIGFWSYRHSGQDPVSYFLAGRGLGSLALTLTTLATLLSAFTFIGAAVITTAATPLGRVCNIMGII